jgi:hypothetical protein
LVKANDCTWANEKRINPLRVKIKRRGFIEVVSQRTNTALDEFRKLSNLDGTGNAIPTFMQNGLALTERHQ